MISQCLLSHEEIGEKYTLVNDILSASNYYEALGISDDSSCDEIRRAYIKVIIHFPIVVHFLIMHFCVQKSRICHPDKFVPPYSKATQSFQCWYKVYAYP